MSNLPISEQFRIVAKQYVDQDAAASLLEETKSAVLAQHMAAMGEMPVSKAEMAVKSTAQWHEYLENMVAERKKANMLKVKLKWVEMRFAEFQSAEATKRAEMRL